MHSLDGIIRKIQRADEHIRDLNARINALIEGDAYRLASEPDTDPREHILKAFGPEPPPEFAIIAGEAIHQLRTSLDHLVWQLVVAAGGTPTHWHAFPICATRKGFESACERGVVKGISESAFARIESRQPYHTGQDTRRNFLEVLRVLNNHDKHRSMILVTAAAHQRDITIGSTGASEGEEKRNITLVSISPPTGPKRPTEEGAELLRFTFEEPEPDVELKGKPIVQIMFGEPEGIAEQPVSFILQQIRDRVASLIEGFRVEFPAVAGGRASRTH